MKKIILIPLFVIAVFSGHIATACGGVFYACGSADVLSYGFDFWQNCGSGDRIQVIDLCHPAEQGYTFCIQDGPCNEY